MTSSSRTRAAQLSALALVVAAGFGLARAPQPLVAQSAEPTYAKEVAPILYKNCAGCHRSGGIGPFSVLDYDAVKKNAADLRDAVKTGYMPPWHAEGPHDAFANDRRLSDFEKSTLLRWVDAGAPAGDLKKAPAKPQFSSSWQLGEPDLVLSMQEDFTVPAEGKVDYLYFQVPTDLPDDRWVKSIEMMPGARGMVHHVLVFARVPASAPAAAPPTAPAAGAPAAPRPRPLFVQKEFYRTRESDEPRTDTLHGPPRQLGNLIGGSVPGNDVVEFPAGTALRVRKGTILTFQMHYTARGHEMKDRTRIGFRFADRAPEQEVRVANFVNGQFKLPAGQKDVMVESELEPTETIHMLGMTPHTHVRGKKWQYILRRTDGTEEVVLDVPNYDFNWQTQYMFAKPLVINAGDKLISRAWYDNSKENAHNPDATKDVYWGDQTWEEMQYTGITFIVPGRKPTP
jgi:mono/diheme cytochrome c family protein